MFYLTLSVNLQFLYYFQVFVLFVIDTQIYPILIYLFYLPLTSLMFYTRFILYFTPNVGLQIL